MSASVAAMWGHTARWCGKRPAALMLAAVACYAFLPLLIWVGVQQTSPLLFTGIWYLVGCVAHTATIRGGQGPSRLLAIIGDARNACPRYFWASVAFSSSWLFFSVAVALSPAEIVAVIFEMWPVLYAMVCLTGWWRRKMHDGDPLDRSAAASTVMFLAVGISGVALAVLSDAVSEPWSLAAAAGIATAVLASFVAAVGGAVWQVAGATDRSGKAAGERQPAAAARISASCGLLGRGILGSLFVVATVVWWSAGKTVHAGLDGVLTAAAAGVLLAAGDRLFHQANHLARRVEGQAAAQVNSLYYLVPVAALVLLVAFADTSIERPDLLIAGAAGVVAVNMVMHLDPEGARQRAHQAGGHGYKAIVIALWACGTLVLLRDDWLPEGWRVWSLAEYWGMIGVFATVFTLILSFRQSRLAERRRQMDQLLLSTHRRIEHMGRSGNLTPLAALMSAARLRRIDTATTPHALSVQYLLLRRTLVNEMNSGRDLAAVERLSKTLVDVEVFVNLRQQARNFAELAVLAMLSVVTVALTVTARPEGNLVPFASFAHDTASLVIAAVFAFLGFDLIDKRREADAPLLRRVSPDARRWNRQPRGWRLEMVTYRDPQFERVLAVVLGAALLTGAVIMLGFKWL